MHLRRFSGHVEVHTPAKINLFLEVLGKRPDGYHELETLIAAVSAYDTLIFEPRSTPDIELDCRWGCGLAASERAAGRIGPAARELLYGEIPTGRENLVWRAAALLREKAGLEQGAVIRLVKRIPAAAGLGGASSDAAATLMAANEAWRLRWPRDRLMELASELGSDIPFFLASGAAVCRGRGERIEKTPASRLPITIVRPPVGLSTPKVYKGCSTNPAPKGVQQLAVALRGGNTTAVSREMANDLQPAAAQLTPWINTLRDEFSRQDFVGHQMSGSGSSYFGVCRSRRHARRLSARLRARQVGAVLCADTIATR